jgi:SAM dependent carboxyl methyltransferase
MITVLEWKHVSLVRVLNPEEDHMGQISLTQGVMEGNGAYNLHAKLPADGAALAVPFLERAVEKMAIEDGRDPIVIADYGSSQGKNSLGPMGVVIRGLRKRVGPDRAVSVFHVDQPSNDFNSLFRVLDSDPDRYTIQDHNVFPHAIGRSFYEQVLVPNSVSLAWSSYAAVWLSRTPCLIPGHFFPSQAKGAARAAFEQQAQQDWETFLSQRAREMRAGARLIVVLPAFPDATRPGMAQLLDCGNDALAQMVDEGAIASEERNRMVVPSYPRRMEELLAPFAKGRQFQKLAVEESQIFPVPSIGWSEYQATGDKESLGKKQALFFRTIFMPSLAAALTRVRQGEADAISGFAARLEQTMIRRLVCDPVQVDSSVQVIVMAKTE